MRYRPDRVLRQFGMEQPIPRTEMLEVEVMVLLGLTRRRAVGMPTTMAETSGSPMRTTMAETGGSPRRRALAETHRWTVGMREMSTWQRQVQSETQSVAFPRPVHGLVSYLQPSVDRPTWCCSRGSG
ncbi:hypothetical protein LINGRAHAP2_LOCUS31334 [Linum grandiflorum]